MREIINRATFTISNTFVAGEPPTFNVNIPVGFPADEFIVRQIGYQITTAPAESTFYVIHSNIIRNGDGIIGQTLANQATTSYSSAVPMSIFKPDLTKINTGNATFTLYVPVNGVNTFLVNGSVPPEIVTHGKLLLTLEFLEYEKK